MYVHSEFYRPGLAEVPCRRRKTITRSLSSAGGSAGISVAARLLQGGEKDVAVIDPAEVHYYQPLWTLVGGGLARRVNPPAPRLR
jgi:hypothetical protein